MNMCGGGIVDAKQKERLALASRVLRALRHRDFRNELRETGRSGDHVVLPALPDDTMGTFFDQLRRSGGTIYIAVPEDEEITVLSLAQTPPRPHAESAEDDCPIHRDTQIQMVVELLRVIRAPLPCCEAAPGVTLELVDEAPPAVPA
jgi:hypothetical protein